MMPSALKFPGPLAGLCHGQTRRCLVFFPIVLSGNRGAVRQTVDAHTDEGYAVRAARFFGASFFTVGQR